jgi:hypothetical protein
LVERNPSSPKKPQSESYRREKETHRESPRARRQRSAAVSGRAIPLDPTGIGMPRRRSKNMGSGGACLHHDRKQKAPFGGKERCRRPLPWRVTGVASTETTGRGRNRKRKGGGREPRRAATVAVAGRTPAGAVGHFPATIAVTEIERGGRGEHSATPPWGGSGAGRARRPPPAAATGARDREWARQWLGFARIGRSGWF